MSINVRIIGDNDGSDEYLASLKIKSVFESTAPPKALGEIVLYPNATLYGQTVKDVDLIMIGTLQNCKIKMGFDQDGAEVKDDVQIESFCTTIEVKSHSASGIIRSGTDWKVRYGNRIHNVTRQSNKQKEAMKSFLTRALGDTPYITNLIFFTEISKTELSDFLNVSGNHIISNAFCSEFDFKTVMELLGRQRIPQFYRNSFHIESGFYGSGISNYLSPLALFDSAKESMGDLTRRKIEMITRESIPAAGVLDSDGMTVYRGRAGTGKTINLMQLAIRLVDEKEARVVILTYNRALVSDIRRLFALADLPDMFDYKCVSIVTLQSFFYHLVSDLLFDGKLDGEVYLQNYENYLGKCKEYLSSDESKELAQIICGENENLNWDYVLIDEAQDWSALERDLIMQLYEAHNVIVADGGQQFVRRIEPSENFEKALREKCGFKKYKAQTICEILFASMDIYRRNYARGANSIYTRRELQSGAYNFLFNTAISTYIKWVEEGFDKIKRNTKDGKLYLLNREHNTNSKEINTILGILEAMDILSFEMSGGANSQLYVYVNQVRPLKNILNDPGHYENRLLDMVSVRHLISVKMLTYIYEGEFGNEKTWDILEDYFLGKIPERVKANCRKENPCIQF